MAIVKVVESKTSLIQVESIAKKIQTTVKTTDCSINGQHP